MLSTSWLMFQNNSFSFETQRHEGTEAQRKTKNEIQIKKLRVFVTLCLRGSKQLFLFFQTKRHKNSWAQRK